MSDLINAVGLQSVLPLNTSSDSIKANQTELNGQEGAFGAIYKSYLDLFEQTNEMQLSMEQLQLDFASGKTDDMVSVILAQEKAYSSLNFTVQVTNKIIEAYREIMRIQL